MFVSGLIALLIVLGLALAGDFKKGHSPALKAVGLYWHFVDVVWVLCCPSFTFYPISDEHRAISHLRLDVECRRLSCSAPAALAAYVAVFRFQPPLRLFRGGAGACFLLTLMSPINTLADGYLFSAHMLQHILLLLIVPALAAAQPAAIAFAGNAAAHLSAIRSLAGSPASARCGSGMRRRCATRRFPRARSMRCKRFRCWCWAACSGGKFWRRARMSVFRHPVRCLYLFSACVTCSVLGIIITFSPVTVCSIYTMPPMDRSWNAAHHSRGLGHDAGTGPANRRAAHVGADVFDLFERDLGADCALVRASPRARQRKRYDADNEPPTPRPGWDPLPPERLPRPTYCPAGMAMGTALIFWGIITSWVILLVGMGLFR